MNMDEYVIYERTGWGGSPIVQFVVARRCDHDGHSVPASRILATFPVGLHSESSQRARANMLAHALNAQAAATPALKMEIA